MKRGKYLLIIILIFAFLILATFASFFYYEFRKPPAVKSHSYLEINLAGEIQDFSQPDFLSMLFLGRKPVSVHEALLNLRKAKVDGRINAVLLRLGLLQCNWAKINELREAILDFRRSGKKIYAYIEEAPDFDKEYLLATACDEIILHPLGLLGINGIGGYVPFFKKTLDKLGVEAEFVQVEEFKTAANSLTEEGFTPAHRMMMEAIYEDIFSQYVRTVAEARNKSEEEIKALIDHGFFQGKNALETGLVDTLLFEDEIENLLKEKEKKLHRITFDSYSKIKPSALGLDKGKKIALIYGMGPIHTGDSLYQTIGSSTVARWIRTARKDKSISAIVFRVDSPGGSAVASDVIWREVRLAKKEKPFVVSMSDVAGSGGYWISIGAHKIVAHPQTLTGSIGVIAGKFNLTHLYEKLGVTSEKISYGRRADMYSSFRRLTAEERDFLKKEILWIYDRFLDKVAEGRNLSREEVHDIGKGRVWTGNQAKEIGLLDEIGGLWKALDTAKELAGIPVDESVRLIVWPKRVSFWSTMFRKREARSLIPMNPQLDTFLRAVNLAGGKGVLALTPLWFALQ